MTLPISVVIPHQLCRQAFFDEKCLPSVWANGPTQVIVESGPGNACEKRNAGAEKAVQPYLVFVDDDSILRENAFRMMLSALEKDPGASFAYCDTELVNYPDVPYPRRPGKRSAKPWDLKSLRKANYIDTTSLMRRGVFPGFDPLIRRFQDWDVWLTLAKRGHYGIYIPKVLFEQHHFDIGISVSVPFEESLLAIKAKHGLV
jgi:glycosyltransferase involved in cell wall biosynthesis